MDNIYIEFSSFLTRRNRTTVGMSEFELKDSRIAKAVPIIVDD